MTEKEFKERYNRIATELPRMLPLCYIATIGIGMAFNFSKFKFFGINIFQYASVFDFLISPFEDPIIICFFLFSTIIPTGAYFLDKYLMKRFPKFTKKSSFGMSDKTWYKPTLRITYLILIPTYVFIASMYYGIYSYHTVKAQEEIVVRYNDNEEVSGKQIGKVGNTLFLLNDSEVKVIPIDSYVKDIQIPLKEWDR